MDREKLIQLLGTDWNQFQAEMQSVLSSEVPLLASINQSLLENSGKQLRPMLSLLMARTCSRKCSGDSIKVAAAVELLHNATLMHDDVTDGSDVRRGVPTLWTKIGASPAVLVGDYWLSKAVNLLLPSSHRDALISLFSKTLIDLSEGEMIQLSKAGTGDTTEEDYLRIIYCKTASMFEAAIVGAAISADATKEQEEAARVYANSLGLAFQIKDDILDYCGKDEMGKPSGVDLKEQKVTLPLIGALKNAPGRSREIMEVFLNIPQNPGNCSLVRSFVEQNGGLEYAASILDSYIDKAISALDQFEETEEKHYLVQIAKYNALRTL